MLMHLYNHLYINDLMLVHTQQLVYSVFLSCTKLMHNNRQLPYVER
jgi:hypothetical protein